MSNFDDAVQKRVAHLVALDDEIAARKAVAHQTNLQATEHLSSQLTELVGDRLVVFAKPAKFFAAPNIAEIRHRRTNKLLGCMFVAEVGDSKAEEIWYEANPDEDPSDWPMMPAYFFAPVSPDDDESYEYISIERNSNELSTESLDIDRFIGETVATLVEMTAKLEYETGSRS